MKIRLIKISLVTLVLSGLVLLIALFRGIENQILASETEILSQEPIFEIPTSGACPFEDNFETYNLDYLHNQGNWIEHSWILKWYVGDEIVKDGSKSAYMPYPNWWNWTQIQKTGDPVEDGLCSLWFYVGETYNTNYWVAGWSFGYNGLMKILAAMEKDAGKLKIFTYHPLIYLSEDLAPYQWHNLTFQWQESATRYRVKLDDRDWTDWFDFHFFGYPSIDTFRVNAIQVEMAIDKISWEAPPIPVLPDFSISEIKPVQVVWDSDINSDGKIDLVAGKSTMVRVEVGMGNYEALDKQQLTEVRLIFNEANYTESRTIEQLEQNNRIEFYPASPATTGDQTIIVKVDPENKIEESNEANNENSIEITVKDTSGLYLVYFPVNRPITYFGYGPIDMEEYSETVSQSGKFISATYPVADEEFTNEKSDWKYYGNPVPLFGMIDDAISIWLRGELITKTLVDRSVGIVPDDYFGYHLRDISGKFFPLIPAVLIENGDWTATAHEIGHTYDLDWPKEPPYFGPGEEYETNPPYGNPASGFWADEEKEIYPFDEETMKGGICFMGPSGAKHSFYYDVLKLMPFWIDGEDYTALFKEFRVDKTDPPDVLLASGFIFQDGKVEIKKWYRVESGIIDKDIIPGDYSIQTLDINGQILVNTSFKAFFEMYIDPATGVETGVTGFAFTIPYPEEAFKVKIQYKDEDLIEFNPNTKLLHDAVDLIPDYGFIDNPKQRRNTLHNKIEAVEKMIEQNNLKGAVNKLKFDIKDKFEKWLVDDYQKENLEQLSKVEVIEMINEIIYRLSLIN